MSKSGVSESIVSESSVSEYSMSEFSVSKSSISEINKHVGPNKVVFFSQKIIRFAAQLFGRSEYAKLQIMNDKIGQMALYQFLS